MQPDHVRSATVESGHGRMALRCGDRDPFAVVRFSESIRKYTQSGSRYFMLTRTDDSGRLDRLPKIYVAEQFASPTIAALHATSAARMPSAQGMEGTMAATTASRPNRARPLKQAAMRTSKNPFPGMSSPGSGVVTGKVQFFAYRQWRATSHSLRGVRRKLRRVAGAAGPIGASFSGCGTTTSREDTA